MNTTPGDYSRAAAVSAHLRKAGFETQAHPSLGICVQARPGFTVVTVWRPNPQLLERVRTELERVYRVEPVVFHEGWAMKVVR